MHKCFYLLNNHFSETALDVYRDVQHGTCELQLDSLARAALDKIVNEIFEDTLAKHDYRACMALGFNTLRLDRIDQAITKAVSLVFAYFPPYTHSL